MIKKLNGSNENIVNEPSKKGIIYKVKKRLFKYFSVIN